MIDVSCIRKELRQRYAQGVETAMQRCHSIWSKGINDDVICSIYTTLLAIILQIHLILLFMNHNYLPQSHFILQDTKHFQNVMLVGMASKISKNYTYKCADRSRHNGIKGAKAKSAH